MVAISNAAGSQGRATGVAPGGPLLISATAGTITGTTQLTVTSALLVSIEVTPPNPQLAAGTTQQFTATGLFTDNNTQNLTTQVTWQSSNATIATISNAAGSQGLATSVGVGTTPITATAPSTPTLRGISGTTSITIVGLSDLVPVPGPQGFCTIVNINETSFLQITVRNQGSVNAPASMTRVEFFPGGPVPLLPTDAIPAGSSVNLLLPFSSIPGVCFNPDCDFRITVDFNTQINESNEGNNTGDGSCLG